MRARDIVGEGPVGLSVLAYGPSGSKDVKVTLSGVIGGRYASVEVRHYDGLPAEVETEADLIDWLLMKAHEAAYGG